MERRLVRPIFSFATGLLLVLASGVTAVETATTAAAASSPPPPPYVVCSPNGQVSISQYAISCTVVQGAPATPGQSNQATCIEQSSSPDVEEDCNIQQTNVSGNNSAYVLQTIQQKNSAQEYARQRVNIQQSNQSGQNNASIAQRTNQATNSAGAQLQTADQGQPPSNTSDPGVQVQQDNGTGSNLVGMAQLATQSQSTTDPAAQQGQQSTISADLNQFHSPTPDSGPSHAYAAQTAKQTQFGPTRANQAQIADPHCCSVFEGNQVAVKLLQKVQQFQGLPPDEDGDDDATEAPAVSSGGQQSGTNEAHCSVVPSTAGNCTVNQAMNQNGATISATCSAPSCDQGQQCTDQNCQPCQATEGGFCPPPTFCVSNCGGAASGASPTVNRSAVSRLVADSGANARYRAGPVAPA